MGNTFIWEQLIIPEDIVGDNVEPILINTEETVGGIKKAFVCLNRKTSKSKQSKIMKNPSKKKEET